jgi:hypothetical protein
MLYRPPQPRSLTPSDIKAFLAEKEDLRLEFKLEYDLSGGDGGERRKGEFAKDILALANTAGRDATDFAYLVIGAGDKFQADGTRPRKAIQLGAYKPASLLELVNAACTPHIGELLVSEIDLEGTLYGVLTLPPSPHVHRFSKDVVTPKKHGRRTPFRSAVVRASSSLQ